MSSVTINEDSIKDMLSQLTNCNKALKKADDCINKVVNANTVSTLASTVSNLYNHISKTMNKVDYFKKYLSTALESWKQVERQNMSVVGNQYTFYIPRIQ